MSKQTTEDIVAAREMPNQLGRFEVLRPLAVGGMAEVLLARAAGLEGFEKLVVIKRVLPRLCDDPNYGGMFLNEARLMSRLHHSNIVQVYEVGEADGGYFMAMEFLDGEDVRAIMRTSAKAGVRIPIEHVLTIISGMLGAIGYAHALVDGDGTPLRVIHRDITPTNVVVTYDGGVKLVDFGIAKASTRRGPATEGGVIKGKFAYMSPEQAEAGKLDGRSDLFSIGIVLWELLTLRGLFPRGNDFVTLRAVIERDVPPPSGFAPGIPEEVDRIVLRCLARNRDARYSNAQEILADIEEYARRNQVVCSPLRLSGYMRQLFADRAPTDRPRSDPGGELVRRAVARWQTLEVTPSDEVAPSNPYDLEPPAMTVAGERDAAHERPGHRIALRVGAAVLVLAMAFLVGAAMHRRRSDAPALRAVPASSRGVVANEIPDPVAPPPAVVPAASSVRAPSSHSRLHPATPKGHVQRGDKNVGAPPPQFDPDAPL